MAAADGEVSDGEDTMQLPPHNDLSDRLKCSSSSNPSSPFLLTPLHQSFITITIIIHIDQIDK